MKSSVPTKRKKTNLLPIEQHIPMNDQPPSLINTMRKATPKNKNVNPPLHLREHQTPHRRHSLLLHLLLQILLLLPPSRKLFQGSLIIPRQNLPARPHVWDSFGEVPTLEHLFRDVVPVIRAYGCFRLPSLLEEGVAGCEFECDFLGFGSNGAGPEVV